MYKKRRLSIGVQLACKQAALAGYMLVTTNMSMKIARSVIQKAGEKWYMNNVCIRGGERRWRTQIVMMVMINMDVYNFLRAT